MKSSIEKKDKMKDPIEQIIKEANIDAKQAQEFKPEALVLSIMEVEEAIERAFIAGQELKAKEVREKAKLMKIKDLASYRLREKTKLEFQMRNRTLDEIIFFLSPNNNTN